MNWLESRRVVLIPAVLPRGQNCTGSWRLLKNYLQGNVLKVQILGMFPQRVRLRTVLTTHMSELAHHSLVFTVSTCTLSL